MNCGKSFLSLFDSPLIFVAKRPNIKRGSCLQAKGAGIREDAQSRFLQLTDLDTKKKQLYVDDYSRKIIELGPITLFLLCSDLSSGSLIRIQQKPKST